MKNRSVPLLQFRRSGRGAEMPSSAGARSTEGAGTYREISTRADIRTYPLHNYRTYATLWMKI